MDMIILEEVFSSSYLTHFLTRSKDSRDTISYATTAPTASL
jgi:hypothetical protein